MPEHVHLLLSEPQRDTLADALKSLKQGVSRRLIGEADHFWQKRYYDFNIRNYPQFVEKMKYIHRNPVKRGLCQRPEDWEWSSFRHYATGCEGRVEIESEWTARKRERAEEKLCPAVPPPHSSNTRLEWPPARFRLERVFTRHDSSRISRCSRRSYESGLCGGAGVVLNSPLRFGIRAKCKFCTVQRAGD